MPGLEIHPLSELRPETTELLCKRFARQRRAEALLPEVEDFEAHALNGAHERGFRSMTVDWRSVNLLSSRFWPRRGFRPQYLRLYRAVP